MATTRYVNSAAAGANNGTSKTDAYTTFAAAKTAMSAGDLIIVSHTHVEPTDATGSTVTIAIPGTIAARSKIVSVNFSNDVPTQGAALYTTSGATPLIVNGAFRIYGCNLSIGTGAVSASLTLANTNTSVQIWQNCNLTIVATAGTGIVIGTSVGGPGLCQWSNVTCSFAAVGQGLSISASNTFSWRNDSGVAAVTGAATPTTLIKATVGSVVRLHSLDLSAFNQGTGKAIFNSVSQGDFEARNCRLNCGTTTIAAPTTHSQIGGLDFIGCKDGASVVADFRDRYQGSAITETTIVRTSGATSGGTSFSWKITPVAANSYDIPFVAFETALWNTVLTAQTLSIHCVTDNVTLTDADIWVQVEYLSSASYPLTTVVTDKAAGDPIPSAANQATSTEAWTTTGLTTPLKQKLDVTFTALMVGPIRIKVVVAKTSGTIYVCPKADLA